MKNTINIIDKNGNPVTGKTVSVYKYQKTSPYYSTKIGDMTDNGNGVYEIDIEYDAIVTILMDGVVVEPLTGVKFNGNPKQIINYVEKNTNGGYAVYYVPSTAQVKRVLVYTTGSILLNITLNSNDVVDESVDILGGWIEQTIIPHTKGSGELIINWTAASNRNVYIYIEYHFV